MSTNTAQRRRPRGAVHLRSVNQLLGYFSSKLVPGLLLFLSIPLLVRTFGADVYGQYARVWAFGLISTALLTGWLRQSVLRQAGLQSRGLGNVSPLAIVAVVILSSAPLVLYGTVERSSIDVGWTVSLALLGTSSAAYSLSSAVVQRDQRVARFGAAEAVRVAGTAYLPLVLHHAGFAGVDVLVACAAVGSTAGLVLTTSWQSLRAGPRSPRLMAELWSYGWPMSLWLACSSALLYTDRFVVAAFFDATTAGQYAAVSDLVVRGVAMVSFPITMAAHPQLMILANSRRSDDLEQALRRWSRGLYAVMAVVFLILVLLGPYVIEVALGSRSLSGAVLVLLGASACLWQAALMAHKVHEIENRTRTLLGFIVLSLLVSVVLGIALVRLAGDPAGAALGALAGPVCYLVLVSRSRRRSRTAMTVAK